jgi:putative hydrolase of the HAD superfamily
VTIRGVLFDLDGTLLDHDAAVVEALHTWLPAHGVTVTPPVMNLWHVGDCCRPT